MRNGVFMVDCFHIRYYIHVFIGEQSMRDPFFLNIHTWEWTLIAFIMMCTQGRMLSATAESTNHNESLSRNFSRMTAISTTEI